MVTMKGFLLALILTMAIYFTAPVIIATNTLAATQGIREDAIEYAELKNKLQTLINKQQGTYGVYVLDIKSGRAFGINQMQQFHAASTFKLPLNIYLYQKIAAGEEDINRSLVFRQEHQEGAPGNCSINPWAAPSV